MKTTETQTIAVNGSTGGTFTLTFGGETTAPARLERHGNAASRRP